MIKINLLGASNDGGGGSVLKPLEVTPLATEQEFIPDGFTGYSYVRVKGAAEAGLTEPITVKSTNTVQEFLPSVLGFEKVTVEAMNYETLTVVPSLKDQIFTPKGDIDGYSAVIVEGIKSAQEITCDSSINEQVLLPRDFGNNDFFSKVTVNPYTVEDLHLDITKDVINKTYRPSADAFRTVEIGNIIEPNLKPENIVEGVDIFGVHGTAQPVSTDTMIPIEWISNENGSDIEYNLNIDQVLEEIKYEQNGINLYRNFSPTAANSTFTQNYNCMIKGKTIANAFNFEMAIVNSHKGVFATFGDNNENSMSLDLLRSDSADTSTGVKITIGNNPTGIAYPVENEWNENTYKTLSKYTIACTGTYTPGPSTLKLSTTNDITWGYPWTEDFLNTHDFGLKANEVLDYPKLVMYRINSTPPDSSTEIAGPGKYGFPKAYFENALEFSEYPESKDLPSGRTSAEGYHVIYDRAVTRPYDTVQDREVLIKIKRDENGDFVRSKHDISSYGTLVASSPVHGEESIFCSKIRKHKEGAVLLPSYSSFNTEGTDVVDPINGEGGGFSFNKISLFKNPADGNPTVRFGRIVSYKYNGSETYLAHDWCPYLIYEDSIWKPVYIDSVTGAKVYNTKIGRPVVKYFSSDDPYLTDGDNANVEYETLPLTVTPSENRQEFTASDYGAIGYSTVTVNPAILEDRVFNPSTNTQNFYPTSASYGIKKVTINPVTSGIDENIRPENIADGVTILGVAGTMEKLDLNYKLRPKYIPIEWIGNINGQNIKYKFPFNNKYDHIEFTVDVVNPSGANNKYPGALMGYGTSTNIADRQLENYYNNLKTLGYEDNDDILSGIEFYKTLDSSLFVRGVDALNYSFSNNYVDSSVTSNPDLKLWSYNNKQTYMVGYSNTPKLVTEPGDHTPSFTYYFDDCVKIANKDVLPNAKLQVFRYQKHIEGTDYPPSFRELYDCFVFFGNRYPVSSPAYPTSNDTSSTYSPVWDKGQYTFSDSALMKLYSCKIYSYVPTSVTGEEGTLSSTPYAEYKPYLVLNAEGVYEPTFINVLDNSLPEIKNIGTAIPNFGIDSLNAVSSNQAELQQVYDSISTL